MNSISLQPLCVFVFGCFKDNDLDAYANNGCQLAGIMLFL